MAKITTDFLEYVLDQNTFIVNGIDLLDLQGNTESISLLGEPTSTTPLITDNSTRIATTEYVKDNLDLYLPLAGGSLTGDLIVGGNFTVNGATTELNSVTLIVEDKNVVLGDTTSPTDITADGGGITLKGTTDKSLSWASVTDSWTSSENIDLLASKTYKIDGVDVLTSTTVLGKTVPTGDIIGTTDTQTLTNKTLDSATLIGTPVAPTAVVDTNTTQLATTAFVQSQIADEIGTSIQPYSGVLAATTASFTTADETKLDFISVTQAVDLDTLTAEVNALASGMVYKGDWDASLGTFPGAGSAQTGWFYYVAVGGVVDGITFNEGDNIVATVDNASSTVYTGNWSKHNQTDAVQSVAGKVGAVTLVAADITDFDTEVGNNVDVAANTAARHDAVTVLDSTEIDFTLVGQEITASLIAGSIDDSKLSAGINASLALADSSLQDADIGVSVQGYSSILDATTASFTTADETKLDGIEALADVTDEANVLAALDGASIAPATITGTDVVLFQDISDANNIKTATAQAIADLALLEYFAEATHTTGTNSTNPVNAFTAIGPETNLGIVLSPKGTGSLSLQVPDGLLSGGNTRGEFAIDLQLERQDASEVASGAYSTILGGSSNTASGEYSAALGYNASTKNRKGAFAFASGKYNVAGDSQFSKFILRGVMIDSSAIALTVDGNAAATQGFLTLDNYSVVGFSIRLTIIEFATNNCADIEFVGTAVKGNTPGSISILSGGIGTIYVDNIGLVTEPSLVVNTTEGSICLNVTGLAARDLKAVATVEITENVFA